MLTNQNKIDEILKSAKGDERKQNKRTGQTPKSQIPRPTCQEKTKQGKRKQL